MRLLIILFVTVLIYGCNKDHNKNINQKVDHNSVVDNNQPQEAEELDPAELLMQQQITQHQNMMKQMQKQMMNDPFKNDPFFKRNRRNMLGRGTLPFGNTKLFNMDQNLDITEDEKAYYISGDFNEMEPKNIELKVKNNHLSISLSLERKNGNFTMSSSFSRTFPLDFLVDESKIDMKTEKNGLKITVPKITEK